MHTTGEGYHLSVANSSWGGDHGKIVTVVFGLLLFLSGAALSASSGTDRHTETATGGQRPFATIIGCSDSREAHEPAKTESEPRTGRHRY